MLENSSFDYLGPQLGQAIKEKQKHFVYSTDELDRAVNDIFDHIEIVLILLLHFTLVFNFFGQSTIEVLYPLSKILLQLRQVFFNDLSPTILGLKMVKF